MIPRSPNGEQNARWWATYSAIYEVLKDSLKPWTVLGLTELTGGKESTVRAALGLMVQRQSVRRIEGRPLQFQHYLGVKYEYHDPPVLELKAFADWKQDIQARQAALSKQERI